MAQRMALRGPLLTERTHPAVVPFPDGATARGPWTMRPRRRTESPQGAYDWSADASCLARGWRSENAIIAFISVCETRSAQWEREGVVVGHGGPTVLLFGCRMCAEDAKQRLELSLLQRGREKIVHVVSNGLCVVCRDAH